MTQNRESDKPAVNHAPNRNTALSIAFDILRSYSERGCSIACDEAGALITSATPPVVEIRPNALFPHFFSPIAALVKANKICESPIEALFFVSSSDSISNLVPQFQIGKYRADFAIPELKICVEIDGHDGHKTREQRTSDARRERAIKDLGWEVVRFTGSEIFANPEACVDELVRAIKRKENPE